MKIPKELIRQKQLQAQIMFFMDVPIDQIAKKLEVHDMTINRWARRMGWRDARKQINEQVSLRIKETVTEMKERQVKITKDIVTKGIKQLNEDKMKINAGDIISAMKHEKEMVEPTQYKSYNLIKNETNIQNTQVNINKSVYDLIKEAKEKRWKLKDKSVMATLEQSNL